MDTGFDRVVKHRVVFEPWTTLWKYRLPGSPGGSHSVQPSHRRAMLHAVVVPVAKHSSSLTFWLITLQQPGLILWLHGVSAVHPIQVYPPEHLAPSPCKARASLAAGALAILPPRPYSPPNSFPETSLSDTSSDTSTASSGRPSPRPAIALLSKSRSAASISALRPGGYDLSEDAEFSREGWSSTEASSRHCVGRSASCRSSVTRGFRKSSFGSAAPHQSSVTSGRSASRQSNPAAPV